MIGHGIEQLVASLNCKLAPHVRNRVISRNDDFMVMLVTGPNDRSDFHRNHTDVSDTEKHHLLISS